MNPSTFRPDNTEDSVGSFSALRTANPSAFRPDRTEDSVGGTFVLLRCEDDEEVDGLDARRTVPRNPYEDDRRREEDTAAGTNRRSAHAKMPTLHAKKLTRNQP